MLYIYKITNEFLKYGYSVSVQINKHTLIINYNNRPYTFQKKLFFNVKELIHRFEVDVLSDTNDRLLYLVDKINST